MLTTRSTNQFHNLKGVIVKTTIKTFVQNQPANTRQDLAIQLKTINSLFKYDIKTMVLDSAYLDDNISVVTGRLSELITSHDNFPVIASSRIYRAFIVACSYYVIKYIKFAKETGVNYTTGESYVSFKALERPVKSVTPKESTYSNKNYYKVKGNKTNRVYVGKNVERYMELSSEFNTVRCKNYQSETHHYMQLKVYKDHINAKIYDMKPQLVAKYQELYNLTPFGESFNKTSSVCSSGRDNRNYLKGFYVPYGDTFQKRLTEFQYLYKVETDDIFFAKALLLEELYGKMEYKDVDSLWDSKDVASEMELITASNFASSIEVDRFIDGMEFVADIVLTPKQYGLNLYLLELYKLATASTGDLSRTMLRFDFVNSGGIHNANSTREPVSMTIANLFGGTRNDSHSILKLGYETATGDKSKSRKDIKDLISQGYFHGQSTRALCKVIGCDIKQLEIILSAVSGSNWDLPAKIADFGTEIFMTGCTAIQWTMPDGFVATASSYSTASKVEVKLDNETIYVEAQLPLLISDGQIVRGAIRSTKLNDQGEVSVKGGKISVRSFYAILIHSFDSYLLRMLYIKMASRGINMDSVLDEVGIRGKYALTMYDEIFKILDSMRTLMRNILLKLSKEHGIPMPDIAFLDTPIVKSTNIMSA